MKDLEDFKKNLVLKASAGSGKTHELASRFVLLLSFYYIYKKNGSFEGISLPKGISSIMALTFTNKAASEMKERIIDFMKKSVLEEEENISFLNKVEMQELLIDLFKNYDELNVTTIDSFMNRIFKAFSVDLGVYPDYEITFDSDSVFEEMFKRVLLEPQNSELLMDFLTFLLEAGENGMDAEKILKKNLKYYSQIEVPSDILTAEDIEKLFFTKWNISEKEIDLLQWISEKVVEYASELKNFIDSRSHLFNMNNSKKFKNINIKIDDEKLEKIRSFLEEKRFENVVKNGKSLSEKDKNDFINMLSNILKLLEDYKILTAVKEAELAYQIIKVINEFKNKVMREQNIVDGSEIAKKVSELLKSENGVTMAYCRLGETIYHYLIDEF
ncbi:MAG: UvrD-helicase domain-containing protein, partial [Calditerrivibrio sp.]|nr:UvrD-helicase domain-containing protein [Calditerrivibrio sp.]